MILCLENLTKSFENNVAVDNFNYIFKPGIYGLLGANGAGKSTLMSLICNILKPTNGKIYLDEVDIKKNSKNYRKKLGYLPQEVGYYPEFTAFDFLSYMCALKGIQGNETKQQINELLKVVGLFEEQFTKIRTFSGGMRQRLGIAQAMLNNPSILILDEPTAGLDPQERIKFRNLISLFSEEKIILISTHIVSDIECIANKILIMKKGKLICEGYKENILKKLENCVWECSVPVNMLNEFTTKNLVSSINLQERCAIIRIIDKNKPYQDAMPVYPNLEDLYLYYFIQEGIKADGKIN